MKRIDHTRVLTVMVLKFQYIRGCEEDRIAFADELRFCATQTDWFGLVTFDVPRLTGAAACTDLEMRLSIRSHFGQGKSRENGYRVLHALQLVKVRC